MSSKDACSHRDLFFGYMGTRLTCAHCGAVYGIMNDANLPNLLYYNRLIMDGEMRSFSFPLTGTGNRAKNEQE